MWNVTFRRKVTTIWFKKILIAFTENKTFRFRKPLGYDPYHSFTLQWLLIHKSSPKQLFTQVFFPEQHHLTNINQSSVSCFFFFSVIQDANLACWQQHTLAGLNAAGSGEHLNQESANPHTLLPLLHRDRKMKVNVSFTDKNMFV